VNGEEHSAKGSDIVELRLQVETLTSLVLELRAELAGHRAAIREEIVTRRIAVADDDEFERIVLVAGPSHGTVSVSGRSVDAGALVELFANDVDGRAHVGVAITEAGDVVSVFELLEGADVRLWIDSPRRAGDPPA
jgi:hypothetical protein